MAMYYTQYEAPQIFTFPMTVPDWSPMVNTVEIPNIYSPPILHFPMTIIPPPQIITPICPCRYPLVATEPIVPALINNTVPINTPLIYGDLYNQDYTRTSNCTPESISSLTDLPEEDQLPSEDTSVEDTAKSTDKEVTDPVEQYLQLSKGLFPSARMLSIDANPIIDEFCKIDNINENIPWILDLEYGAPRLPVRRAIAIYDVKYNSVHCKNTPNAIHPGFEKCNGDFRRVLLFYYDCIVSNWYNGYTILKYDNSVENFQTWLLVPMQVFGISWC